MKKKKKRISTTLNNTCFWFVCNKKQKPTKVEDVDCRLLQLSFVCNSGLRDEKINQKNI